MNSRLLLTIGLISIACGAPNLHAQSTFIWQGGTSGDVTDPTNWPDLTAPSGTGGEDVTFGSTSNSGLIVPSSSLILHTLTFTGSRPDYTISGSDSPTLYIQGDLINDRHGNLTIDNTLSLVLTEGIHTVSVASGTTVTVAANIGLPNGGGIEKEGSGTLDLTGHDNYGGNLTANSGTVALDGAVATNLGENTWNFNSSSVLKVSSAAAGIDSGTINFNDNAKLSTQVANTVTSSSTSQLYFFGSSSLQASANLPASGSGVINGGTQTFEDNALLKAGVTNSISGGSQYFLNNAILTASGAQAIRGGTQIFSQSDSSSSDLTRLVVNGAGSIAGGDQIFYGNSSLQANNTSGGSVAGGTQTFYNDSYLRAAYGNSLTGGSQSFFDNAHLEATATGAVGDTHVFLANNSYITVGATDALSSNTEISFWGNYGGNGGTLNLNDFSTTVGTIGSAFEENPHPGFIENDGSGNVTLTVSASDSSFDGVIRDHGDGSGTLGLLKTGAGYLTLGGHNTYTGGTEIHQGFLVLGAGGTTGSIRGDVVFTGTTDLYGGELQFNRSDCYTFGGDISGPGRVSNFGSGTVMLGGSNTYTGGTFIYSGTIASDGSGAFSPDSAMFVHGDASLLVNSSQTIGGLSDYIDLEDQVTAGNVVVATDATLTINNSSNYTFSGPISGDGDLVKTGTGAQTLSGVNTYAGSTTINGGTLIAGNNSAFSSGTITINGGSLSVASGITLTNPLVFAGSAIVLGGNGTFGTAITADSHVILSPGNSPGNLTFSAGLALASGGTLTFQVQDANGEAGTGWDLLSVSGMLSGPNTSIDITAVAGSQEDQFTIALQSIDGGNFNPTSSYSWTFATAANGISGFASNKFFLDSTGFADTLGGTFSITQSDSSLLLNFTPAAVPEPSTWALLIAGLGTVAMISRRRRRHA